jgi:hypothetical protein
MVNCGLGVLIDAQANVIAQSDTDITLLTSTGNSFAGTVNGDIVEWMGDLTERGGTTTIESASIIASAESASGNATWSWTDGTDSCNGTMDITASRNASDLDVFSNSRLDIAQPITVTDGVEFVSGSLNIPSDPADYFFFVLTADATVQIELSHFDTQANDLILEIIDNEMNQFVFSDSADNFEIVEAQLLAGVVYFVGVRANTTTGTANYSLSIDVN